MINWRSQLLLGLIFAMVFFPTVHEFACGAVEEPVSMDNLISLRKKAAHRKRRIIQNNDGCDIWFYCKDSTDKALLDVWTSGLKESGVDAVFYTTQTGVGTVVHNSKIASPMTATSGAFKNNLLKEYLDRGTDPLRIVSQYCRTNDLEIFASFRMNDIHSGDLDEEGELLDPELHSPWKVDHPEYLLGIKGTRHPFFGQSRSWAAANYELRPVRDYIYQTIEEVCMNYDLDGIELDFFRHPLFFKSHVLEGKVTNEQRQIMTAFVRRIRDMLDRESLNKGRVMLLSIRVPDSAEYCEDIGLHVEEWLKDGLVDILVPGGYFQLQPWEKSVELGHRYDVPVYPCLSDSRELDNGSIPERNAESSYRGRALQAWSSGSDGIYLFNAIYLFPPNHKIYSQLGDPEVLNQLERTYFVNALRTDIVDGFLKDGHQLYCDLPELNKHRPMKLSPGQSKKLLLKTGSLQNDRATLLIDVDPVSTGHDLQVQINGDAIPPLGMEQLPESTRVTFGAGAIDSQGLEIRLDIENCSKEENMSISDVQLKIN